MVNLENNHDFMDFNNLENNHDFVDFNADLVCTKCGIWTDYRGVLIPRCEVFVQEKDAKFVSCDEYNKVIQYHMNKHGFNSLGHKWRSNRPSVLLWCDVCDIDIWLSAEGGYNRTLKTCDEVIMNKVLK